MKKMFNNAPSIYTLKGLWRATQGCEKCINDKWVPARPCGFYSIGNRFKAAWLVFSGKADAVKWPGNQ